MERSVHNTLNSHSRLVVAAGLCLGFVVFQAVTLSVSKRPIVSKVRETSKRTIQGHSDFYSVSVGTFLSVSVFHGTACMSSQDKGWAIDIPFDNHQTAINSFNYKIPALMPFQPFTNMGLHGEYPRNTTANPMWLLNKIKTPKIKVRKKESDGKHGPCLIPERLQTLDAKGHLTHNPNDGTCGVSSSGPAVNCSSKTFDTIVILPMGFEVIKGIYHTLLNRYQMFSLLLSVLNKAEYKNLLVPAALHGTFSSKESAMSDLKHVVLWSMPWQQPLPNLTQRIQLAMEKVLSEDYGIQLHFAGPNVPMPPSMGGVWSFDCESSDGCREQPCFAFLNAHHADRLRSAIFPEGPKKGTLVSKRADILLVNRHSEYYRHINNSDALMQKVSRGLNEHGWVTTVTEIDDFGPYDVKQADISHNHSVYISAHGQQDAAFVFAPKCSVQLEIFPFGAYNHIYGVMSVSSGHIYGMLHVDQPPYWTCSHPHKEIGAISMSVSNVPYRECVRQQNLENIDAKILESQIRRLLKVREVCLEKGFDAIPVPNFTFWEREFFHGRAHIAPDFYYDMRHNK